ncbi:MAG: radical SAM protein, partial [Lachnospiraceae bacterium]|nr:radical SAM protein [Lachnospiraceae bacterium]
SLQSGCDATLKRMNRHYDTDSFSKTCEVLREFFKDPAITTDVIVGFPGESESEFEQTKHFLERISFSKMHIFKYSRRKGTIADKMPGQIDESEKSNRSDELHRLDQKLEHDYLERFIGKREKVLFEEKIEKDGRTFWTGLNERYARICVETGKDLENKIEEVEITGFLDPETLLGVYL